MARWRFFITHEAEKNLADLDSGVRKRVREKMMWFIVHVDDTVPFPLGGQWRGLFKLRIGDLRIIYEIDQANSRIIIHMIGRRDKIYKRS